MANSVFPINTRIMLILGLVMKKEKEEQNEKNVYIIL